MRIHYLEHQKKDPEFNSCSTHSIKVTAKNLLHQAGMADSYINKCIFWLSTEFLTYLCNTIYAADAHTKDMNVNLGPVERQMAS